MQGLPEGCAHCREHRRIVGAGWAPHSLTPGIRAKEVMGNVSAGIM